MSGLEDKLRGEQPQMECPGCGALLDDFDGMGVLAHVGPLTSPE